MGAGRLIRGQQFHRNVQTAFLTGLVGADAQPEHTLSLHAGRRRVDLLILPKVAREITAVVVEVKNSDWDTCAAHRVKPNLRRHISQLQDYLDHFVENLRSSVRATDPGSVTPAWDSVIGVLLYPKRPEDSERGRLVEDIALQQALSVVWYDETEWRQPQTR